MVKLRHFTAESEVDRHTNIEPNIAMDFISLNFQGSAVQQPSYPKYQVAGNRFSCYNCGIMAHTLYQCTEPCCSTCQQTWNSINDPRYHHMSKCPTQFPDRRPPMITPAAPRPAAPMLQPSTLGTKRTFQEMTPATTQPRKQPYVPRPTRPQFPPRGTAPRPMRTATVTSSQPSYDEVDYNDIWWLRSFVLHTQQTQYNDQQEQLPEDVAIHNPEDADWNPDLQS